MMKIYLRIFTFPLHCTVLYCTVLYCVLYCNVLYCTVLTQGMRKTAQMRMTLIWSSTVLVVADMCFVTVIPEYVDIQD